MPTPERSVALSVTLILRHKANPTPKGSAKNLLFFFFFFFFLFFYFIFYFILIFLIKRGG